MKQGGWRVSKNQRTSEWPETHFGLGTLKSNEIFEMGIKVASGQKQASKQPN